MKIPTVRDLVANFVAPDLNLNPVRDAITRVVDALRTLGERRQALDAERARAVSAAPPPADVVATIRNEVARLGEAWRAEHGPRVLTEAAGRVDVSMRGEMLGIVPGHLGADPFSPLAGPVTWGALCAVAPDLVVDALTRALPAYESGLPMHERAVHIETLDREILNIEHEVAAMVDQAARAGVDLGALPAGVAAERAADQRQRDEAQRFDAVNASAIKRGAIQPRS